MKNDHNPYHQNPGKHGVLLVNLGTPKKADAWHVGKYLATFLADKRVVNLPRLLWLPILYGIIVPFRSHASAKKYRRIFNHHGSPLHHHTQQLAQGLATALPESVVEMAMCYSEPNVKTALERMRSKGVMHLTVLPLYPQYSATTVGAVFDQVTRILQSWRYLPSLNFISQYVHVPAYINAMVAQMKAYWQAHGQPNHLLLSYHGIPQKQYDLGDPYACFCHKTTRLIKEALEGVPFEITQVFQSQFGPSQWLEPACEKTLEDLAHAGTKRVDVFCPGFAVDCLETIDEIDFEYKTLFASVGGGELHYIPALNATPAHVEVLQAIVSN